MPAPRTERPRTTTQRTGTRCQVPGTRYRTDSVPPDEGPTEGPKQAGTRYDMEKQNGLGGAKKLLPGRAGLGWTADAPSAEGLSK